MTGLDKLQEIGAHKIYEKTHIAKKFVEDILNKRYSSMNKIQFTGFISILEREYNVDLHELTEAFALESATGTSKSDEPFVVSQQTEGSKQKKSNAIYIISGLLVMGLVIVLLKPSEEEKAPLVEPVVVNVKPVESELNNTTMEEARVNLNNLGNEIAVEEIIEPVEEVRIEPVHTSKFEVVPRSKLWIGIVDLETFKRTQKLTSSPFELDKDKEWLLVMGHGFVNFEVNGEEESFKDEGKVWFSYENGVLRKLSRSEFKEKNRGKAW